MLDDGRKRLLLENDTGRLFIQAASVLERALSENSLVSQRGSLSLFWDLESWEPLELNKAVLYLERVRDDRVFLELRRRSVTGLRPVGNYGSSIAYLPIAGNLFDPSWLSICLGGKCDSRCVFCYTEWIRKEPPLHQETIYAVLRKGRDAGVRSVAFTGGEPTLAPELPELMSAARGMGYRRITIQTNGHAISDANFLEVLKSAGLSAVLISLHGPSARIHDAVSRCPKSFERVMKGLRNLRCFEIETTVNFVVCKLNQLSAMSMPSVLGEFSNIRKLIFSFWIVEGAAFENATSHLPSLSDFIEWIAPAIRRARSAKLATEVWNIPNCISSRLGVTPKYEKVQRRSLMQASPFYATEKSRGECNVKLQRCDNCSQFEECSGVQLAYLRFAPYGVEEICPI